MRHYWHISNMVFLSTFKAGPITFSTYILVISTMRTWYYWHLTHSSILMFHWYLTLFTSPVNSEDSCLFAFLTYSKSGHFIPPYLSLSWMEFLLTSLSRRYLPLDSIYFSLLILSEHHQYPIPYFPIILWPTSSSLALIGL